MFYDVVLLRRQNQGRFAMAWVASTRGINTVIREFGMDKVRDIDIATLCDETMIYLSSGSINPKERISLRMAVHLLEGTIIVFAKKVAIFEADSYRAYNIIATFPKEIFLPERTKPPTQRMFKTPPTPVVKEKGKRKRPREELPEEIIEKEPDDDLSKAVEIPLEFQARREDLTIVDPQRLQVDLPDEIFGEFDVGPTSQEVQWVVPQKPPSEISEKSQLDKIVEQLIEDQDKETSIHERKKSSSSSVDEGPRTIQVEAMVHQEPRDVQREEQALEKESSSSGAQEGPTVIVVEALVHRSDEIYEVEPTSEQPPRGPTIVEPMEIEEIQAPEEAALIFERTGEKETEIAEKEKRLPKKTPLRQLQADEITTAVPAASRKLTRKDKEKIEREEKITKNLKLKFKKPKTVLHLDDYNKMAKIAIDFRIKIFVENKFSTGRLTELFMSVPDYVPDVAMESERVSVDQMRFGGTSSASMGSNNIVRMAPSNITPQDSQSSQLLAPREIPASVEFKDRLLVGSAFQSTPMRDPVVLPPTQLYSGTRIEYDAPVPEAIDRQEHLLDVQLPIQEKIEEEYSEPLSTSPTQQMRRIERKKLKNDLIMKVTEWDESQGYLSVDDLIPEPKNRRNAAKLFFVLLVLAKEQRIVVLTEENSLEAKYVKKGTKCL